MSIRHRLAVAAHKSTATQRHTAAPGRRRRANAEPVAPRSPDSHWVVFCCQRAAPATPPDYAYIVWIEDARGRRAEAAVGLYPGADDPTGAAFATVPEWLIEEALSPVPACLTARLIVGTDPRGYHQSLREIARWRAPDAAALARHAIGLAAGVAEALGLRPPADGGAIPAAFVYGLILQTSAPEGFVVQRPEGEPRAYGACDFEVDFASDRAEPPPTVRGDVARVSFYMELVHGVALSEQQRKLFEAWSHADPPDAWERERTARIKALQGIGNPFVERYPLTEITQSGAP